LAVLASSAVDWWTGAVVTATIAEFDEGCAVIAPAFPDICRGAVAIQNTETTYHPDLLPDGGTCEIAPGVLTPNYRTLLTRSGRAAVNCQYVAG
jgi:hypothetical protein